MNFDDLQSQWNRSVSEAQPSQEVTQSIQQLDNKMQTLAAELKRRDTVEILVSLVLIPVWGVALLFSASTLQSIGFVAAIVSCLWVAWVIWTHKPSQTFKVDMTRDYLQQHLLQQLLQQRAHIYRQKQLLETVVWWYLLPLGLSLLLIVLGGNVGENGVPSVSVSNSIYIVLVVVLYAYIYKMNINAARTQFDPMLTAIDNNIAELDQS